MPFAFWTKASYGPAIVLIRPYDVNSDRPQLHTHGLQWPATGWKPAVGWGWPHPGETSGSGWWPGSWQKHRVITRFPQQRYHGDMVKTCLHILINLFKYHQGNRSWKIRRQPAMKPFDKIQTKLFYNLFETLYTDTQTHTHIYR